MHTHFMKLHVIMKCNAAAVINFAINNIPKKRNRHMLVLVLKLSNYHKYDTYSILFPSFWLVP